MKVLKKCEKGQAIVEFALVLPLILILFIGIIDISFISTVDTQTTNATQEAAKYFSQQANTPKYVEWYDGDANLPDEEKRINIALKERVVKNINMVDKEHINVSSEKTDGGDVTVKITVESPSPSRLTFNDVKIRRQVTLKIPN